MAKYSTDFFANNSNASQTATQHNVVGSPEGCTVVVQVIITVAATVVLEGRNSPSHPWSPIGTYTSSYFGLVPMASEIRAAFTGNTGSVSVSIAY